MRNLKKSQSISSHHNNLASLLPFRNCDTLGKNPVFYPLWDTFANPRKCFPETHSKYSAEPDFLSSLFFFSINFLSVEEIVSGAHNLHEALLMLLNFLFESLE